MLSTMPFDTPRYPRDIVDLAGAALAGHADARDSLMAQGTDVDEVIRNWQAAHEYPLSIFGMTLRNRVHRLDPTLLVAQRRKRLSSIEAKLQRYDWLTLSEMQDVAGCRAIVDSVQQVFDLVKVYKRKYSDHKPAAENDYINNPKSDGYRSYHLIYRYSNKKQPAYEGLKVEIQIRSKLQHYWATAVETADIFYRQGLKAHRGTPEWRRFFALMGAAIAVREDTHHVPRTPRDKNELIGELRQLAMSLDVKRRLSAFGQTVNLIGEPEIRRAGIKYVVLVLDPGANKELTFYGFNARDIEEASRRVESEERFRDAVLVSVSDAKYLQQAFPNYYLDTTEFIKVMEEFI